MDIKINTMKQQSRNITLLFVGFSILFFSCNNTHSNVPNNGRKESINDRQKWLKQYAFCSCIKYCFNKDTDIKNDLSFTVYYQITDYPKIYQTIDSLAKKASLNIQPSQITDYNHKKALLQGCIDFYESKQLDSTVKNLTTTVSTSK
jgi:hypothetical protein